MKPRVSVVIPTYRRPDLLTGCLESLAGQSIESDAIEICVVDDASGDETPAVLERLAARLPNLRWASQPTNQGPAAARNRAVGLGTAPVLVFLDDDVVATETLIEAHLRHHDGHGDDYGVVGHLTWLPGMTVTPFMRWLDEEEGGQFRFAKMTEGPQPSVWNAFYTCNLSMKRARFERAGGFDERFPMPACEDSDLGARLGAEGFVLDYRRDALAWHARSVTLDDACKRARDTAKSHRFFASLHPELGLRPKPARSAGRRALSAVKRNLLRLLAPVAPAAPSRLGRDLRNLHYRAELGHAHHVGLAMPAASKTS